MEDYIKRQIDMIGQMLLQLAKKLRLIDGNDGALPLQTIQDEIQKEGFDLDIDSVLGQEYPVEYMVKTLGFSDQALETFVEIIMKSDAEEEAKQRVLSCAVAYLDNKGYYSFSLHSYL